VSEVEYTNEFEEWWRGLDAGEQKSVAHEVELLEAMGPTLDHPYSSCIEGSRHPHMRELRVRHHRRPHRVFYAFDPRRRAILLIGGDKTGNDRFYEEMIPIADRLYDQHLERLRREGLV
jgi:hypothetical protein